MAEIFFTLFLFVAITCVTAALFGGWVLVTVFRVLAHGINAVICPARRRKIALKASMKTSMTRTCINPRCKSANPSNAQFCRRCGQFLPQAQRVAVRRAALW
jgi:hypothetical protein